MKYFLRFSILIIAAILLAVSSCTKEAPTVNLGDYVLPSPGGDPGYFYPFVSAVYPTGVGVPVNTEVVIVFNMPVLAADFATQITAIGGGAYNITPVGGSSSTARITFVAQLPELTPITVNVGAGIREAATGTVTMLAPYSWIFTTGTAPDSTAPAIVGGSNTPTSPPLVSLTAPNIQISFNEAINPTTINSTTFYLERVDPGPVYVLIPTYCGWNPVANPTTATLSIGQALEPTTQYRVTVAPGMTDLSGNPLPGTSWTFDTVNGDPFAGVPTITGPTVPYVSDTTANIVWATSEATDYALNYGQGDDTPTTINSPVIPVKYYSSTHSYLLNPPLSPGRRYYVDIDYSDYAGNAGVTSTPVVQFNTETDEAPLTIDTSPENQLGLNWITYRPSAGNTGAYMFWRDQIGANYYLYGKLFDSGLGDVWGVGTRKALFTGSSTTYLSSVEDGLQGVVVLAMSGASNIYAKRVLNSGAFDVNWGATADQDTDLGLAIGTGTNSSAVPVYSGIFTQIGPVRTTEMNIPANPFYDFNQDLRTGITNGDIIYRTNAPSATSDATATISTNFQHVIGQSSAAVVATNTYEIFDSGTSAGPYTAHNHNIVATATTVTSVPDLTLGSPYNSGGTTTYTEHGVTGIASNGNLVYDGTNYARINAAVNTYGPITPLISSADDNNAVGNLLRDVEATFPGVPPVESGDYVLNTSNLALSTVTNPSLSPPTEIGLSSDIFDETTNENYNIYDQYCSVHVAANLTSFAAFDELPFDWGIDIVNTDTFTVYNTSLVTGTADTPPANPLYDDGVDLSAVAANDIVLNYTDGTWTFVNDITYRAFGALGLNANIMSDGDTYAIIRGTNGVFNASNILDIGSAQGGTLGTTLVTDGVGVVGGPIAVGDIAYNYTDNDYAMVTNAAGATLTISRNASFGVGDRYIIVRGTGVLYTWQNGTNINASVRSLTTGNALTSASPLVGPNVQTPVLFPDGKGNAYLVYQTTAGQLRVRLFNAALQDIWGGQDVDTQGVLTETPLKVISDNADGVIVLYQYNDASSTMHVQRIRDNSGVIDRPWGVSGYALTNTSAPTSYDVVGTTTNAIVAAQVNNDIYAWRRGTANWSTTISNSTGIQQNPKIFVDSGWTLARILWEDNRFSSSAGYGIFGMQVNAATGAKNVPAWRANTSGTNDDNGVAVVLNSGNKYWPLGIQIVPYNNGLDAALIWEDWRNIDATVPYEGSDLLYIDIEAFTPY